MRDHAREADNGDPARVLPHDRRPLAPIGECRDGELDYQHVEDDLDRRVRAHQVLGEHIRARIAGGAENAHQRRPFDRHRVGPQDDQHTREAERDDRPATEPRALAEEADGEQGRPDRRGRHQRTHVDQAQRRDAVEPGVLADEMDAVAGEMQQRPASGDAPGGERERQGGEQAHEAPQHHDLRRGHGVRELPRRHRHRHEAKHGAAHPECADDIVPGGYAPVGRPHPRGGRPASRRSTISGASPT